MKESTEINYRVFLKYLTTATLAMAFVILPFEGMAQKQARIYGRACVIMKSGDVKPVAKKDFVLLPFSLYDVNKRILEESKKYARPEPIRPIFPEGSDRNKIEEHFKKLKDYDKEASEYYRKQDEYRHNRIMEEIQKAKNQGKYFEFRTDFDGSYGVIVPPGSWYVCSQYKGGDQGFAVSIGNARIVWSVPITVRAEQVLKLDLENDNASHIFNKQE